MLLREFSSRAKQLTTALERWEEDGGPAAADCQVAREKGPGPAVALLATLRDARRVWLCSDALAPRNTRRLSGARSQTFCYR